MLSLVAGIDVVVETDPNKHNKAAAAEEEEIEITGGEFEDGGCSLPQEVKSLERNKHL